MDYHYGAHEHITRHQLPTKYTQTQGGLDWHGLGSQPIFVKNLWQIRRQAADYKGWKIQRALLEMFTEGTDERFLQHKPTKA